MSDKGKKGFKKFESKADQYINDKEKTRELLDKAVTKANNNKGPIKKIWGELQLLFGVIKDWVNGSYKEFPTGSLVMAIVAVVYFVSPVDLVPDFLPAGLLDDAAVVGFVIKQIHDDLEQYKIWKTTQK
ncbi:Uncharacterized membrane protein YkvA, DUF1232 family [Orenia metallireducens]|uniref:Uncharacterized membrane protein YkvA, DUF1232 family n=1 Tax=Orenia metallireducens TaxID=1413210 RepID=A0A285I2S1_9FIRM|nr:YkvA family protein [Orenia metallireducens]SNY41376.1 Uncharacterized membrane protein YkvA, DUF1232 family [Orenia metallireducens]